MSTKRRVYNFKKGDRPHLDQVMDILGVIDPDFYHQDDIGEAYKYDPKKENDAGESVLFLRDVRITVTVTDKEPPMSQAYLTVQNDAIIATPLAGVEQDYHRVRIVSKDDLDNFVVEYGVDSFMCSSTMDFPEEYTKREDIIELARQIRSV